MTTTKRRFIAIAPYAWGEGDTADKAKRIARRNVPSFVKSKTMQVYEVGKTARVTGDGGLAWQEDDMKPRLVA